MALRKSNYQYLDIKLPDPSISIIIMNLFNIFRNNHTFFFLLLLHSLSWFSLSVHSHSHMKKGAPIRVILYYKNKTACYSEDLFSIFIYLLIQFPIDEKRNCWTKGISLLAGSEHLYI